jgi:hypothetical protein
MCSDIDFHILQYTCKFELPASRRHAVDGRHPMTVAIRIQQPAIDILYDYADSKS